MSGRICIRDLPNVANVYNELKILIEKISPVIDIYLPPITITGVRRDFAIVTINADNDTMKKCVKVFNNCHWKGGKIKVEIANEYYKDRLKRERDENECTDIESSNDDDDVNVIINIDTVNDTSNNTNTATPKDYITIKKIRSGKRIMISTVPSLAPLKSRFKKIDVIAPIKMEKSKKDKNNKNKNTNDNSMIIYHCGWKINFDDNGNPIKPEIPVPDESTIAETEANDIEANDVNDDDIKPVVSAKIVKEVGGGVRRGFGTLLSNNADKKKVTTTTTDNTANDKKEATTGSDDCGCLPMANEIPENDFIEHNPYLSDDDDVPCVSEQELKEENLAKERDRMKLLLGSVLGIEPSHYTNTEKAPININKIQAKTWGDIFIKRYDPTKEDSKKYEIGVTNIDNDDNSSGNSDDDDDDSNNNDSDDNDVSNNDSDDDDIDDGGVAARENNNDNVLGANNSDARSSENAANTNIMALKDIFHKQDGGVWFGDDGTLKQTVAQGNAASDLIFREAEKMGIDVRSETNDDKVMKFSFFDDNENNADNNDNEAKNDSNSVYIDNTQINNNEDSNIIKLQPPMSLIDIVKNAKKFQRDKSVDELRKDWLDTRDKLKIDYKRKRKDDKKKRGVNSNERSPYNRNETVGSISKFDPSISSSLPHKRIKSHRGGKKAKKKDKV